MNLSALPILLKPKQAINLYYSYWVQFQSALVQFLPNLIAAALIYFVGSWVIRRLVKLFRAGLTHRKFDSSLESFLLSLSNIGLRILLIFTVASQLGIQTTSFVAILGAAGLAVGLALQGTLANFAGGVLLLMFRPFKIGDLIEAQGQTGKVVDIQIFNTVLRTANSKTVVIPNGILSNGIIVNSSQIGTLVFEIKLEVDRSANLVQIRTLILSLMATDSRILTDPPPSVTISGFSAGYFVSITGHSLVADQVGIVSAMNEKIWKAFSDLQIPTPQVHTYVHSVKEPAEGS